MMKKIFLLFSIVSCLVLMVACEKEESNKAIGNEFVINASSKTKWVYFSFSKGDTVQIADALTSKDWDIAFQRYMVKTNGGKSGMGLAASFNTKLTQQNGYDALKIVPDSASFVTDDSVKIYGYNPANPSVPTVSNVVLNAPLYGWYNLITSTTGGASTLVPYNYIYVVKTADGKYAKLWIKSYYSDTDGASGHIKIQYKYQADGSKNIE